MPAPAGGPGTAAGSGSSGTGDYTGGSPTGGSGGSTGGSGASSPAEGPTASGMPALGNVQGAGTPSEPGAASFKVGHLAGELIAADAARNATGTSRLEGAAAGVFGYRPPKVPQLLQALAPTIATASAGAAAWAAFAFFGKRRRDDHELGPDSVLATAAAEVYEAQAAPGLRIVDESLLPRWRRPSLLQVRKTDPLRAAAEAPRLSFETAGIRPLENFERRYIRYRLVRLLDSPDEYRSGEIAILDQGDEVQLLQRRGVYWLVLCPDGRQGWVHRMVLADRTQPSPAEAELPEPEPYESVTPYEMPGLAALPPDSCAYGLREAYVKASGDGLRSMGEDEPVA